MAESTGMEITGVEATWRVNSMKSLVIYDSQFGNTEKIAQAIAEGISASSEILIRHIDELMDDDLTNIDLIIVGSPTQRFSPTPKISEFIKNIPGRSLDGVHVAAFDTRFTEEKIGEIKVLEFFVKIFGYAAKPIARQLQKSGGLLITEPEGFYVADTEGPLLEAELMRATEWGRNLA
jgi:flavodoxin